MRNFLKIVFIATYYYYYILLGLILSYGFAWVGHYLIDKNKPATLKYPFHKEQDNKISNTKIENKGICIEKMNNLKCGQNKINLINNFSKNIENSRDLLCANKIRLLLCNRFCSFDKKIITKQIQLISD